MDGSPAIGFVSFEFHKFISGVFGDNPLDFID
jgi:hypothetical protein